MKRVATYNAVVFMAPVVALAVGGLLYFGQKARLSHLKNELEDTKKEISEVKAQLLKADKDFVLKRHPSEVLSKREQGLFLDMLRKFAQDSGVEITRWSNVGGSPSSTAGTPASTPAPSANGAATGKKLPPDINTVSSMLDVRGEYSKVRSFLYKLQLSPRLLTIQQAHWVRDTKDPHITMASFSLARYVRTPTDVEKQAEEQGKPIPASNDTKEEKVSPVQEPTHENKKL